MLQDLLYTSKFTFQELLRIDVALTAQGSHANDFLSDVVLLRELLDQEFPARMVHQLTPEALLGSNFSPLCV